MPSRTRIWCISSAMRWCLAWSLSAWNIGERHPPLNVPKLDTRYATINAYAAIAINLTSSPAHICDTHVCDICSKVYVALPQVCLLASAAHLGVCYCGSRVVHSHRALMHCGGRA
jgi:hypothetical protein